MTTTFKIHHRIQLLVVTEEAQMSTVYALERGCGDCVQKVPLKKGMISRINSNKLVLIELLKSMPEDTLSGAW